MRAAAAHIRCILKVQYPFLNFLSPALIPELSTYISAGTSCDIHLVLIAVSAFRAFPDKFAVLVLCNDDLPVKAADLTVIALGIQLGIHYIIVYKLHHLKHSLDVILHVGHFDIRYRAARRQCLELAFKRQLFEGVYLFGNMYVIGICNIILVGNARYYTETLCSDFANLYVVLSSGVP